MIYRLILLSVLWCSTAHALVFGPIMASSTPVAPSAPTLSVAQASATTVTLTWTTSTGTPTPTYDIYRSTSSGTETLWQSNKTSGYVDTVTTGQIYYYVVKATNTAGTTASNEVNITTTSGVPSAPTGHSTVAGNASITLHPGTASGATSYKYYLRATSDPTTSTYDATGTATDGQVISSLTNGTTYKVGYTAINGSGESVLSTIDTATPSAYQMQDSFTGTDGTTLASHTADTGQSWSVYTPYASNTASITSNTIQVDNGTGAGVSYYSSLTPSSADYTVSVDCKLLTVPGSGNYLCAVMGRLDSAAGTTNYYQFEYVSALGGWLLAKAVNGTATQVGTTSTATLSAGQTYTAALVISGNTITGKVNGITVVGPITDSTFSAAGKAGFAFSRGSTGTGNGFVLDNFKVQ